MRTTCLPGYGNPETVVTRVFADQDDAWWLDGGADTPSYLGTGTRVPLRPGHALADLRAAVAQLPPDDGAPDDTSFRLGLVGWLTYEREAAFLRTDRAVAVHPDGSMELLTADDVDAAAFADHVRGRLARPAPPSPPVPSSSAVVHAVTRADDDEAYLANIRAAQEAITDGLAYVLCLTTEYRVTGAVDPLAVYQDLRRRNPTHHGGFLRIGGTSLLSTSPERFLQVTPGGQVTTRPIKGTRPRGRTPEQDRALAAELATDGKERAENVMIVDLMRNDLQRVCAVGSVTVPSLWAVESYAPVHQLVSTVQGQLLPGFSAVEALDSCFPAGSMTGAPKISAMRILASLENRPRGLYAGTFGHLGPDGRADLAMTIRSIVVSPSVEGGRVATVGVGGGITALSDPERELAEMELKATALLEVLGAVPSSFASAGTRTTTV